MDQAQQLTYQQLLAEQYEENAKNLLVYQQTAYDDVEGSDDVIEEHNADRDTGQELVDAHEFQQFSGARGTEHVILKSKEFHDSGVNSVRRAKDVKNHIFNIDTHFRPYAVGGVQMPDKSLIASQASYNKLVPVGTETSTTSHFIFNLDSQYKNIISAKLSSLQIPNKFFNLVDSRNNYYIYTRKGLFNSDFTIPFESIGPNPKGTYSVIQLSYPINPLVVDQTNPTKITIQGTGTIYDNNEYDVLACDSTTVSIAYSATSAGSGTFTVPPNASNSLAGYTRVGVYITSANQSPRTTTTAILNEPTQGQTGFYYTNTSIIPALNTAYSSIFPTLKFSYLDGHCSVANTSTSDIYTLNLTPEANNVELTPAYFPTLGEMLGLYNYVYEIHPANSNALAPCNISCGQISACTTYGSLLSESKINMNADSYILLAISNWENVLQQDGNDSYYGVFQKIPINVAKGETIYDIVYNNSVTKKYDFLQPSNVRYLEIWLYDRLGNQLLMPGVSWSMSLELEEVLNSALYDKLREI
jgi:hypothetical protein